MSSVGERESISYFSFSILVSIRVKIVGGSCDLDNELSLVLDERDQPEESKDHVPQGPVVEL